MTTPRDDADHGSKNKPATVPGGAARPVIVAAALVSLGLVAVHVGQQSSVQSAWQEAAKDCSSAIETVANAAKAVSRAGRSIAKAGQETAAAWRQNAPTSRS